MLAPFIILALAVFLFSGTIHKIEEGHIGLYWRGGALIPGYTEPGYHVMAPLLTSYANIQVSVQTDRVENIPVKNNIFYLVRYIRRSHD
jgi:hypothetical protein